MPRFTGIHHLAMVTGDMEGTVRFWRDLLGMRLAVALGKPGYRHYFFEVSPKDFIAFFEWSGAEPVPPKDHGYPVSGPVAFDHVSFGVESREELWDLKDRLAQGGFWVSEVIDHGFVHSLYSFDPNGIAVEFSWEVEEVDVRRRPVLADREPPEAAKEGPEPRPGRWGAVEHPTPPEERKVYPGVGSELFHGYEGAGGEDDVEP